MKFQTVLLALLFIGLFTQNTFAQRNKKGKEPDVTVFESVLKTAEWANFKYVEELERAKTGDQEATFKLLKFSGTVDGKTALDHSVTLLELLSGRDQSFALPLSKGNDKLRAVLLDRLQLAQARTTKEALRQPIETWAPITWDVLNGKAFSPAPKEGDLMTLEQIKSAPKKPGNAESAQPSDLQGIKPINRVEDKPKGKQ